MTGTRIAIGMVLAATTGVAQTPSVGSVTTNSVIAYPAFRGGALSRVTGQPFSAQEETETIQTLSDGTHINNGARKVTYYRDSLGRTRTERTAQQPPGLPGNSTTPPVFIDIEDPVAGFRYTLDSNNHTAHRVPMAPIRTANGQQFATTAVLPASQSAAIQTGRLQATLTAVPPTAPVNTGNTRPRPEVSTVPLGTQTMEGVLVEGSKTTTTWPVGSIGNDRPVSMIRETWTSRALGMTVMNKTSDPRSGETTTKLTNILQSEPDPSLFLPPADYQIVDPPAQK